ncbi:DUF6172 family protein [Oceanisphaera psychrotolerans]|uniref:Uncharacterized protein n=1 Tax=Oceanisphaera psychrotolerans TaxID=1414654 RepID=A0A1J4QFH5_9GAMM|nr:DUF6172 family protein [Oceanisphaera psychrotolerans]OIN08075.1 hypothetical protein BFR47_15810 [Oceanisphaera psychrotolerans]
MKKTIALTHPKLKPARLVDSIKHDIKKYLNRERRKSLPAGMDYWTFDCRFGASEAAAEAIYTSEINKHIDAAVAQELPEFYVEILARACNHAPRSSAAEADDEA